MVKHDLNENPVTLGQFKQFQQDVNNNFKKIRNEMRNSINSIKEIKVILGQHTHALLSIESTMKIYGDMYQVNKESIDRLSIRMDSLERA